MSEIYWGRRGVGGVVFAHPILACAYAGYLSPELEVEIGDVWLRYRAGDPTLADEVLERTSPEANLWVASRAEARAIRNGLQRPCEITRSKVVATWNAQTKPIESCLTHLRGN
jgi:hypothetical protein